MSGFKFDARARLSIELALAASSGDLLDNRKREESAKRFGMTGAEIDALRQGSSFDFQLSRAVALALTMDHEDRERAMKAGLDAQTCAEVEGVAAAYRRRSS